MKRLSVLLAVVMILVLARTTMAGLCTKCRTSVTTDDIGKCTQCGKMATSSGAYKLCRACSTKSGKCEMCMTSLKAPAASGAAAKAAKALDAETFEAFKDQIKDAYPSHVTLFAIARAKITSVKTAAYCPLRTSQCGANPTCGHPKREMTKLGVAVGKVLLSVGDGAVPKAFENYTYFGKTKVKEGQDVTISLYAYKRSPSHIARIARIGGAGAERVSLFDGKTLKGWKVLKCEAEVSDGDILITAGNGLVQSEKQYKDFILEFEWKKLAEKAWDSGVYFRYTDVPKGRPWPGRYQANLRKGMEGNVGGIKGATSTGLIKPAEWNKFKLTVKGPNIQLEINGKLAWKATGLKVLEKGYIALQAEVPQGGKHRFRNIFITER